MKVPPARATLPVLVTVKVCCVLVVPVAQLPKASELGVTLKVRVAATPDPLSETGEPATATLAAKVAVPLADPVAVGVKTTLTVQLAPAAKVAAHVPPAVPPGRENGAVIATAIPVAVAPPELVSVRGCEALVVPTG